MLHPMSARLDPRQAPATPPDWEPDGHGSWCLPLQPGRLPVRPDAWPPGATLRLRCDADLAWTPALVARLHAMQRGAALAGGRIELADLPSGCRDLLDLAASAQADPEAPPASGPTSHPSDRAMPHASSPGDAVGAVAFLGAVLIAGWRLVRGRARMAPGELLRQLDEAGPRSVPVVAMACALIGLMLAYMGGAQLARMGAQTFLADVVTVGMVRELGGMMAGIILAGRIASAHAAQLASMQAGEELDALRVLGVDPVAHLVLPRLAALQLLMPGLFAAGALAGVLAGWPAATLAYGLGSAEYLAQSLRALNATHLWIGLFKAQVYALLVGLAGCLCGLQAGRGARAVGAATTAAVVKALVWIVAAASLTTVVFTSLGY